MRIENNWNQKFVTFSYAMENNNTARRRLQENWTHTHTHSLRISLSKTSQTRSLNRTNVLQNKLPCVTLINNVAVLRWKLATEPNLYPVYSFGTADYALIYRVWTVHKNILFRLDLSFITDVKNDKHKKTFAVLSRAKLEAFNYKTFSFVVPSFSSHICYVFELSGVVLGFSQQVHSCRCVPCFRFVSLTITVAKRSVPMLISADVANPSLVF